MQNIKREQSIPKRPEQANLRWDVLLSDLSLFASLCLAQLIVSRTLRRRREEESERLKRINPAPPAGDDMLNKVSVDK